MNASQVRVIVAANHGRGGRAPERRWVNNIRLRAAQESSLRRENPAQGRTQPPTGGSSSFHMQGIHFGGIAVTPWITVARPFADGIAPVCHRGRQNRTV